MSDGYPMGDHPDEAQDQAQIDTNLNDFVQQLVPILQAMAEKIDYLEDRVDNQLIGGLSKAYADKAKGERIEGLKGKHGARFQELLGPLAEATGEDPESFWDELHGKMGELGVGEGDEDGFMDQIHGHLSAKKEAMLKALMSAGGAPDAAVEVKAMGEPEAVAEAVPKAAEKVKEAVKAPEKKSEAPAVGSPEFFAQARRGPKAPPKARK